MGVVDVPGHEPWFIANYELRLLFERAAEDLTDAEDRATLERAAAFSGLMLEHYDPGRQDRLARALQRAANALAQEVAANPRDVRDRRAALAFESLVRLLDHVPPAG